jgi:glycerol kinase
MQFQADILRVSVDRPEVFETTALGAAFLAGLASGVYANTEEIENSWQLNKTFHPEMPYETAEKLYRNWEKAVEKSKGWT